MIRLESIRDLIAPSAGNKATEIAEKILHRIRSGENWREASESELKKFLEKSP